MFCGASSADGLDVTAEAESRCVAAPAPSTRADEDEFYGEYAKQLRDIAWRFEIAVETYKLARANEGRRAVVSSLKTRIKTPESMAAKLERRGLAVTPDNAVFAMHDAAGARVICPLIDDVDELASFIRSLDEFEVLEEKDYIRQPKANGYRSLHMIIARSDDAAGDASAGAPGDAPRMASGAEGGACYEHGRRMRLEVQLRTIAQDSWASIEHQLKYKKNVANPEFLAAELKRCADEMAASDLSLQSLADLVAGAEDEAL